MKLINYYPLEQLVRDKMKPSKQLKGQPKEVAALIEEISAEDEDLVPLEPLRKKLRLLRHLDKCERAIPTYEYSRNHTMIRYWNKKFETCRDVTPLNPEECSTLLNLVNEEIYRLSHPEEFGCFSDADDKHKLQTLAQWREWLAEA
jgi:hypothetical protein